MKTLSALVFAFSSLGLVGCSGGDPEAGASPTRYGSQQGDPSTGAEEAVAAHTYAAVQAILTRSCAGCHGTTNPKEGLDLSTYATLMKGGEHGPVVEPGNPSASRIVKALRGEGMDRMPYKLPPLPEEEIATIESWIRAGAKGE